MSAEVSQRIREGTRAVPQMDSLAKRWPSIILQTYRYLPITRPASCHRWVDGTSNAHSDTPAIAGTADGTQRP